MLLVMAVTATQMLTHISPAFIMFTFPEKANEKQHETAELQKMILKLKTKEQLLQHSIIKSY